MKLSGKRILFLGSSVTRGIEHVSFADFMAENCGVDSFKEAVSGTLLADINDQSYVSRLKRLDTAQHFDLCICQLSTNDTRPDVPISKTEDAIRFIIEYVRANFGCPIAFYTGTYYDNEKYATMIEMLYSLMEEYDFPILDLFHDEEMRAVTKEDYAKYMKDPVHPTVLGYKEWWTPRFVEFCEKL